MVRYELDSLLYLNQGPCACYSESPRSVMRVDDGRLREFEGDSQRWTGNDPLLG